VPALESSEQRRRLAAAPVARLATLRADGTPRLVPITFVLVDGLVCSVVDEVKPKRSTRLARLDDVRRDPRVALVADHYDADWSELWWVRVDGTAAVLEPGAALEPGPVFEPGPVLEPDAALEPGAEAGPLRDRALAALVAKYPPYAAAPPDGALLVITPTRWAGWSAA
jgi:PPOX class probable F420-dependent enzyme